MSDDNTFGAALKHLRAIADLSLKELAERAGLTSDAIVKLESGARKPSWETVLALARVLGVDCTAFQTVPETDVPTRPRGRPASGTDILSVLPNWSDRDLRWLIDCIERLNAKGGRVSYTVIQKQARTLLEQRMSGDGGAQRVADAFNRNGHFILVGMEGHQFGRCVTETDCRELAEQMGLGIVDRLALIRYPGNAFIQKVEPTKGKGKPKTE
jgi:transcriptional regulator with XRE-family HTH domain